MKAAIIMGSKSDYPVIEKAEKIFDEFGVEYETRIMSAHRTPKAAEDFAENAEKNGFEVIIAAAGKAAHLAGVIAAQSPLPGTCRGRPLLRESAGCFTPCFLLYGGIHHS